MRDYTCVNFLRTLPYVQAWHERYRERRLTVIGVHTPEFTFAQYESSVERGIREFGLTSPVVVDSSPGVAAFAFTFTGCVDPVASALQASTVSKS